jgi:murein DD-endopeptidase MepM/ murein hydrolase activator NlpD
MIPGVPFFLASISLATISRAKKRVKGIVKNGVITSPFGPRGPEGVHAGIDISAVAGSEVRAAWNGIVVDISPDGTRTGYGNTVIVEHGDRSLTLYAHLQGFAPGLHVGQYLTAGDPIGYLGATHAPNTSPMGAHLHFETHKAKALTPEGRLIVNPDVPRREDPVIWLARHRLRVSDTPATPVGE